MNKFKLGKKDKLSNSKLNPHYNPLSKKGYNIYQDFCIISLDIYYIKGSLKVKLLMKKDKVLKKHSGIISISKSISLTQKKAFNGLLYKAREDLKQNPSLKTFTISMHEIKQLVGRIAVDNTKLKESLKELLGIVVEYNILEKDKTYSWVASSLISRFKISDDDTNTIEYSLASDILENLLDPRMYVPIDLSVTKDLKSKYSLSIYEILSDYRNLKDITIDINDFKKSIGVPKELPYARFNQIMLSPSIEEINNKTNLTIKVETEKNGRVITKLKFTVKDKNNKKTILNKDLFKFITKIREYDKPIYYPYNDKFVYIKEKDDRLMYDNQEELTGVNANLFYDEMFNAFYDKIIDIIDNKKTRFFENDLEELKFIFLGKNKYLILKKNNQSLKYFFKDIVETENNLFTIIYLLENKQEFIGKTSYSFEKIKEIQSSILK